MCYKPIISISACGAGAGNVEAVGGSLAGEREILGRFDHGRGVPPSSNSIDFVNRRELVPAGAANVGLGGIVQADARLDILSGACVQVDRIVTN